MRSILFYGLLCLFWVTLTGFDGCEKKVMTNEAGIPRKLIIRKDKTLLYASKDADNTKTVGITNQWDIYFLYKEYDNTYLVSPDVGKMASYDIYVKKSDVFEWNTYFSLTYKGSPNKARRAPVMIYPSIDALDKNRQDTLIVEENNHGDLHLQQWQKPVLQDLGDDRYLIACRYMPENAKKNDSYNGDFTFGYLKYRGDAICFCRYVSRFELEEQMKQLLGVQPLIKDNMTPEDLNRIFGPLSNLIAKFGPEIRNGLKDIINVFSKSKDIPKQVQTGPFDFDRIMKDSKKLNPIIRDMVNNMNDHLKNNRNWSSGGYSYIPTEWMKK